MEGFLRYDFGGLIFGGAYTWRGLFSEFYGILDYSNFLDVCNYCRVSTIHFFNLKRYYLLSNYHVLKVQNENCKSGERVIDFFLRETSVARP